MFLRFKNPCVNGHHHTRVPHYVQEQICPFSHRSILIWLDRKGVLLFTRIVLKRRIFYFPLWIMNYCRGALWSILLFLIFLTVCILLMFISQEQNQSIEFFLSSKYFCQFDSISSIRQNQSCKAIHGTCDCFWHRWHRKISVACLGEHQTCNHRACVQSKPNFVQCLTFLPAATKLWPRLCFYSCLWFCPQGGHGARRAPWQGGPPGKVAPQQGESPRPGR